MNDRTCRIIFEMLVIPFICLFKYGKQLSIAGKGINHFVIRYVINVS